MTHTTIYDIPEDLIVNVITPFLEKSSKHHFFSTCHHFFCSILQIRTYTFDDNKWSRFCEDERFHQNILRLVGYPIDQGDKPRNKRTLILH